MDRWIFMDNAYNLLELQSFQVFVKMNLLIYRVSSGAMIKIAGNEGDGTDRLVTITGTPESVGMAQYLINSRLDHL